MVKMIAASASTRTTLITSTNRIPFNPVQIPFNHIGGHLDLDNFLQSAGKVKEKIVYQRRFSKRLDSRGDFTL